MSAVTPVGPLRCPRCGGEVEVETQSSGGYYRETEVVGIDCTGGETSSAGYAGCGARWAATGEPR